MKPLKMVRNSAGGFLLALFLLAGCSVGQSKFEPTAYSRREAIAVGQVKEFLSAIEARALAAERNKTWTEATNSFIEASAAAWQSGQLQKALLYANRALETAEKTRDAMLQLQAVLRLTSVLTDVGQPQKAIEWLQKGVEIAKRVQGDKEISEARLYTQLGKNFLRQGEPQKALDYLPYALQILESRVAYSRRVARYGAIQATEQQVLSVLKYIADANKQLGNLAEARQAYERAISIIKSSGLKNWSESDLYAGLGQVYLAEKNFARAQEYLQRALQIAQELELDNNRYRISSELGNLFLQIRDFPEAVSYFQRAIQQIESTRSLLSSEEYRQSFFEGGLDAYVSMVGALLESGKPEGAFNYSERARSRAFLDLVGSKAQLSRVKSGLLEEERTLQERIAAIKARLSGERDTETDRASLGKELREAENAYNAFLSKVRKQDKEQASLMSVEPLTLKEVQELLDPGTTLIEYFVAGPNILVWVIEKDKLRFVRANLSKEKLSSLVKSARENIFALGEREKFNEVSAALYRQLIQPVLPHINGKELIIVPHDVLHYLPFHALLSPDGHYLIEKYPIYYLSSASLLQFTKEKRRAGKGDRVLALGNPDLGDPKMNLQFAELEAKEIQGLYPQSTVLLEKEATEEKGKALSPQNDIIHFATHAELSEDDPLSSAILLAKGGKEDGRLEVREIFGMDLHASLVVLSACETGLGKLSSGDELVGLTRAFIYAGTPSVVASLWNVEDSSTAALMASFYKNLKTISKVEALRQAQLELIKGQASSSLLTRRGIGGVGKLGEVPQTKPSSSESISVSTSHPFFWAPFILVGDGK